MEEDQIPCVLIVEDDPDVRDALRDIVRRLGCEPVVARHGLEALRYLRGATAMPRMILLDLMMPVMDGREFLRRRDDRSREVPVVVLTSGNADHLPAGVRTLQKPVSVELLLEELHPCWR
jgi:CheY-like chemotaxis protein